MAYKRLLLQIFFSFLAVALLALISITWYSRDLAQRFYLAETRKNLENNAVFLSGQVLPLILEKNYSNLQEKIDQLGAKTNTRISIILVDGTVIADSDEDPQIMENHGDRPEIKVAFTGKTGTSQRFSHTLGQNLMYVALPLYHEGKILAAMRTSLPLTDIEKTLNHILNQFILAGLLVSVITALIAWLVSQRISAPYEEITKGIERIAQGELNFRIQPSNVKGLEKLVDALNQMVSQLEEKISMINSQSRELNAVLQSMVEGVIAVDQNKQIITMNKAAYKLLALSSEEVEGKKIKEIVHYKRLRKIITNALKTNVLIEDEIIIPPDDRYVQLHGTVLNSEDGKTIGALVVLHDVTRLRRLEVVRRDFVANVSHEIRTPLTSIKGFVETLRDGALNEPETAKHFLDIISTQSNRMNSIIDDLLTLASLEESEERANIQFEDITLMEVIKSAIQICQPAAKGKHITLTAICNEDLVMHMNSTLVEQALVNLIDNALKYSPENTKVEISCEVEENGCNLLVKDEGIGIAKEQLPRIFERFYRIDKARSRKMGGTGLGLAIVKHIAKVHSGKVTVESEIGKGSTFKFYIPYLSKSISVESNP